MANNTLSARDQTANQLTRTARGQNFTKH